MLDLLKSFLADFDDGAKAPYQFDEGDYRLAAAALLVHIMSIDGSASAIEKDRLRSVLQKHFSLDDTATDELIAAATEADREAIDLYRFTSRLNRSLDEDGRKRMVEMMWEIVYADGERSEFEDNVVWRAADLLGISGRERVELRQRVAVAQAGNGGKA
jgi:uncharacterized tellurite resistance protein B-like protein